MNLLTGLLANAFITMFWIHWVSVLRGNPYVNAFDSYLMTYVLRLIFGCRVRGAITSLLRGGEVLKSWRRLEVLRIDRDGC